LGPVSLDRLSGNYLPYVDNLVRLVVAEDLAGVSMEEVMRVLSPGGTACVKSGDAWQKTVKPWPAEIDQWTHYLHGPDNNAVAHDARVGPPRPTPGYTWRRSTADCSAWAGPSSGPSA